MSTDRHKLVKEIFADALERADPAERAACLAQACGGDVELRQSVEALLRAYEKAGAFLEQPAAPPPAKTIALATPLTEKPGDKIGPYKLLQQIGEGGCGVVYMAEQAEPIRRRVALKVIKLGMDTKQVIARFEAERQALALMDHPNIARVLDAGATETGRPYFVMELVRGLRITDYCDQNNFSTEQRLDLFMQVCHAIQHAHQKGIIHRDIKPSNIMVTVVDGQPVPKVIDFGIAKAIGQQLTEKTVFTAFEQFIGTPAYMSPEQAELSGVDVDTRGDIYALGVLLYELLTSHTPFDPKTLLAAGMDEMRRVIREEEPPRPSTRLRALDDGEQTTVAKRRQSEPPKLIHQVQGDLDWIAMKCLEKERRRRYETANALALDIKCHLDHRPVAAAAPTLRYRLAKFSRRNCTLLATALCFVLLLAAGAAVSIWQAVRATRVRNLAERQTAQARENLWVSYLTAARASRTSGRPGRRFAALEAAARAAAIRSSPELRSEAASALALADVRTVREWEGFTPGGNWLALDRRFERYARNTSPEHTNVSVRRVSDDRELLVLSGRFAPVCFSADGRFLLGMDCGPPARFGVWDLDTGHLALEEPLDVNCAAPDFHPNAPVLAAGVAPGVVKFFDLAAGRRWSFECSEEPPAGLRFRPDGQQLAISSWTARNVQVYEADSGKLVATLTHSNGVRRVDWSPDGRWLAVPCDNGRVYLWDMSQGGTLERVLEAHNGVVSMVCFDPLGEFLVSQSWDSTTAVWSLPLCNLILRCPGCDFPLSFSADGRWLGPFVSGRTVRLLEVARAPEYRVLPANAGIQDCNGVFSPDGRWVVVGGSGGLQCWDVRSGQRLWSEPLGCVTYVTFRPDGGVLLVLDDTGAREWPWLMDAGTGLPRLGQARPLSAERGSEAEYSHDGSVLVISQGEGLWVSNAGAPEPKVLSMPWCTFATVSPDGRWAAAAPWGRPEMKVWELPSGREVFHLTNSNPALAFTRNGRWLVMNRIMGDLSECLEVGTWRLVAHSLRDRGWHSLALSADSQWVALEQGRGQLQVCALPTFRPLLTLDAALESPVSFSTDGALLLTRRSGGQFGLWNLRRIQEELTPLGLGW